MTVIAGMIICLPFSLCAAAVLFHAVQLIIHLWSVNDARR
jgi:hypothetical protein